MGSLIQTNQQKKWPSNLQDNPKKELRLSQRLVQMMLQEVPHLLLLNGPTQWMERGSAKTMRIDSEDNIFFLWGLSAVAKLDSSGVEVWDTGMIDEAV